MRIALFLCIAVMLTTTWTGCDYERIKIMVAGDQYIGTVISDRYNDVEVRSSGLLLKPGARLAIKSTKYTQFIAQYEAQILSGEGMTVYLRTVQHKFDPGKGVAFKYSTTGCSVRTPDGKTQQLKYNADMDQQMLTFTNEAGLVGISVGCNKIYEDYTNKPGTEYIIFETLPNSTVELRSLNYFDSNVR